MTPLNFIRESRKWKVFNKIAVYFSRGGTIIGFFTGTVYVLLDIYRNSEASLSSKIQADDIWPLFTGLLLVLVAAFPAFLYYVWFFQIAPFIDKSVYDPSARDIDEYYRGTFRTDYFKIIGLGIVLISGLMLLVVSLSDYEPITKIATNLDKGFFKGFWVALPTLLLLLCIGLFALLVKALPDLFFEQEEESTVEEPLINAATGKSLGILTFEDLSLLPNPKLAILSERAPTWLSREINKHQLAESYDYPSFLKEYQSIDGLDENAIREKFNRMPHRRLIKGSYSEEDGKLHLHSEIKDRSTHKTLKVIEVDVPLEEMSKGVKELTEKVLGWLAREDKKELNLEQNPISYRAFLHLEKAKEFYHDSSIFMGELEKALDIDPDYFEPKILRVGYYFNLQDLGQADACLKELENSIEKWDSRQKNLILLYRSLLKLDYASAYQHMKEEYFLAPRDLQTNSSVMSMALFYVNKPSDMEAYFEQIPMSKEEIRQSDFCRDRLYLRAWSQVLSKQFHAALDLLRPHIQAPGYRRLKEVFLTALIRSRQFKKIEEAVKNFELLDQTEPETLAKLYLKMGTEFLLINEPNRARLYLQRISRLPKTDIQSHTRASALFYSEDYSGFLDLYEEERQKNAAWTLQQETSSWIAIALAKTGKRKDAEELFTGQEEQANSAVSYAEAQFQLLSGHEEKAMKLLRTSLDQGHYYTRSSFANDPLLDRLHNRSDFHQLLRLRH